MALVLNEEERLLQDTAKVFLLNNAPVSALRTLRDEGDALGYSHQLWEQMAEMGWAGVILPEQYGGLDFGFLGMSAIIHEAGHNLTASPLIATAVLGASAILLGGSAQQKETLLPEIAAGRLTLALALEESNHHNPLGIELSAVQQGDHYLLNGRKLFVMDGHSADKLIVVARSSGSPGDSEGISLFLVDADASGVNRTRTFMADSRNAANIDFVDVRVAGEDMLATAGQAWPVLEAVLDRGRIALAAEMLGGAWETFNRTVEYLKEREQFGVKIGTFQGLQHRAAHLFAELEMCKSVVLQACSAVDDSPEQVPLLASLAKAKLNDVSKLVTNEAVQMHGGMGVTDELEIGFFLKRARVAMQLLGDAGFHKDRYATLCGY